MNLKKNTIFYLNSYLIVILSYTTFLVSLGLVTTSKSSIFKRYQESRAPIAIGYEFC